MIALAIGISAVLLSACDAERIKANDRYDDGDVDSLSSANFGDFIGSRSGGDGLGGGDNTSGNSDENLSPPDDYDEYPYVGESESAYNYPDFGLKHPKVGCCFFLEI